MLRNLSARNPGSTGVACNTIGRGFASQRAVEDTAGLLIIGFGLVLNTSLLRTVAITCKMQA